MHYHTLVRIKWHLPLIRPIKKSMEILLYRFSVAVAVDLPEQLGVILVTELNIVVCSILSVTGGAVYIVDISEDRVYLNTASTAQNFLAVTVSRKFAMQQSLTIPPHLKCIVK